MIRELHIINKCNASASDMLALTTKIMPQVELEKARSCKRAKSFIFKGLEANIKYEKSAITIFVSKEKKVIANGI